MAGIATRFPTALAKQFCRTRHAASSRLTIHPTSDSTLQSIRTGAAVMPACIASRVPVTPTSGFRLGSISRPNFFIKRTPCVYWKSNSRNLDTFVSRWRSASIPTVINRWKSDSASRAAYWRSYAATAIPCRSLPRALSSCATSTCSPSLLRIG